MSFSTKDTVLSLNPLSPLLCSPETTIQEAAMEMVNSHDTYMLVTSPNGELQGIFTAKDLAFRVVGSKLNFNSPVSEIMTANPICAKRETIAGDALKLMVLKQFRHLPIIDNDGSIIGVLDITRCYKDAMKKLEKMYEESQKLHQVMDTVNKELGNQNYMFTYFENLRKLLNGPCLKEVLCEKTRVVFCDGDSNVYDACMLMKKWKTTAVLIKNLANNKEIYGIFTSKDVVSRVISKGLTPEECLVKDVMMLHPECADWNISINSALKKMFEGKYLNLPVVDDKDQDIVGTVDIIRLTNFTLNQIQTMEMIQDEEDDLEDDLEDVLEEDEGVIKEEEGHEIAIVVEEEKEEEDGGNGDYDVSMQEMNEFDVGVGKRRRRKINFDNVYFFKFNIDGEMRRVSYRPSEGFKRFEKMLQKEVESSGRIQISYTDEDEDEIFIHTDKDLRDCIFSKCKLGEEKIEIHVHKKTAVGGNGGGLLLPVALFTLSATIIGVFTISRMNK